MDFKWGYPFIMRALYPGMMRIEPIAATMMSMSDSRMMFMESTVKYRWDMGVVSPIQFNRSTFNGIELMMHFHFADTRLRLQPRRREMILLTDTTQK